MRRLRHARLLAAAMFTLVMCGLSGCGSGRGDVSGTVKIDGKTANLDGLQVTFLGEDGRPVCAVVGQDGTYRAVGVQRGDNKVGLAYLPPDVAKTTEEVARSRKPIDPNDMARLTPEEIKQRAKDAETAAKTGDGPVLPKGFKNPIPERYRDPRNSPLSLTVESGKGNGFDIDVTP